MCILSLSLSSYAPFSSTVSCVWQMFHLFLSFPSLHLLAHAIDRMSSPMFSVSLLPLCDFLLSLMFPFPATSCTHPFLLHPLCACSMHCCPAELVFHAVVVPADPSLYTHTHCFHICPFARVHNQNLHICRFGDASQNTRHVRLHHLSLTLRLVLSDSQQITAVILSLFPSVSPIEFSNTYNTP